MKRSILILAVLLFSATSLSAQWGSSERIKGNGEVTTETRNISAYDEVSLLGSIDVDLVSGREGKLRVEAESNLHEYIQTEVDEGTLKISVEKGIDIRPSGNNSIRVIVPFEDLKGVLLTGSGDISTSNVIRASIFETRLTGSGNISLDLEVEELYGKITGSGNTMVKGSATSVDCKVTGSGDFEAHDLKASEVKATVLGSGDIQVYASGSLQARVMGSGDIHYRGKPKKENFRTSGSGSISSR